MSWLIRFAIVVMLAAGCSSSHSESAPPPPASPTSLDSADSPPTSIVDHEADTANTLDEPPPTTSTAVPPTTTAPDLCIDVEEAADGTAAVIPTALQGRVKELLSSPRFDDLDVSFSASIDGYRNSLEYNADLVLLPASNQKVITAFGVAELLDLEDRFETRVVQIDRDLFLLAGGDPSLTRGSLAQMADAVTASGVTEVRTLYVVADHYTTGVAAPGWQDWQLPTYVGPLSALMVDDNRYRTDDDFVMRPALSNTRLLAELLRDRNVAVVEVAEWTQAEDPLPGPATVLASVESPTVGRLASTMLLSSDNQNADQLVNEIGFRFGDGSIASGNDVIAEALELWCVGLVGTSGDGSGLSRQNWRSAGEFRRLLEHARNEPWFSWFESSLPIAGQTGTLSSRFHGTPAQGRVLAKTGSIIGGRALSGYGTTRGGQGFVFSIIINGDPQKVADALTAMDAVVVELASA